MNPEVATPSAPIPATAAKPVAVVALNVTVPPSTPVKVRAPRSSKKAAAKA